jgi:hypothetical protein
MPTQQQQQMQQQQQQQQHQHVGRALLHCVLLVGFLCTCPFIQFIKKFCCLQPCCAHDVA